MNYIIKTWMISCFAGLFCLNACKQKSDESWQTVAPITKLTEEFKTFYDDFHTDSVYQKEHIVFPLLTSEGSANYSPENWIMHKPFDDMNGTFKRDFSVLGQDLVTEIIYDHSKNYAMERRFAKTSNGWNLIFYDALRQTAATDSSAN